MAEVCSAHPTSGGPYFWAAMLSEPQNAAFASWVTGWFNLLGQVAVTTGIRSVLLYILVPRRSSHIVILVSFACATFISTVSSFGTDFVPNEKTNIGVYAAVLVAQGTSFKQRKMSSPLLTPAMEGLINTFGVHLLKYLNNISVWWHALGTTALVIAILAKAPTHQTGKFVFRTFIDATGVGGEGWSVRVSPAYVVVVSAF